MGRQGNLGGFFMSGDCPCTPIPPFAKLPLTATWPSHGVLAVIKRMIPPFRLHIIAVDGPWKLNQTKTAAARAGVIAALDAQGGAATDIAQAMRDVSGA